MTDEKPIVVQTTENIDKDSSEESKVNDRSQNKKAAVILIIIAVVVISLIVTATYFLMQSENSGVTEQIRDVFIIFMAFESLIIGIALIILIIQLSTLINLLQNEIRPIINSTNETVNTLKGTAQFLSDNLSEPVIKINEFMAVIKRLFSFTGRKK